MATSNISVEVTKGIATISLNEPHRLNALRSEDYTEFANALRAIDKREDVIATVWQANGRWFCAGTDVKQVPKTAEDPESGRTNTLRDSFVRLVVHANTDCTHAIYSHSKILVAALNGPVMGIAAAFLGNFDIIYAVPEAWLSVGFSFLGISAEGGASVSFINRMGVAKANEVLLFNKRISAPEMLECGFINKIIPSKSTEEFHSTVHQHLSKEIDGLVPSSLRVIKSLIKAGLNDKSDFHATNLRESYAQAEMFSSGTFEYLQWETCNLYKKTSRPSVTEPIDEKFFHTEDLHDPHETTLHRGLKARHMSMIAIGGAVGTGLIMSSGTALVRGGPLGLCLGFLFVGLICFLTLAALGEMAAYLPHKRGLAGYATRYADPALGFALGWIYLIKYLVAPANNINAAGIVMQYWTVSVPIEVWTVLYIVLVVAMNLLGVQVFGELEFWMNGLKVLSLMGLVLLGIIIDLGGNPKHDRIGFRYWQHPNGPMGSYLLSDVHNESLAIFLGFWSTLSTALFAYIGSELVAVTAGEAQNPRETIPRAVRATFFRIFIFYVGCVFAISLIVPSTSNELFVANSSHAGAAASPFIVGITLVGIKVLNHILNAMILLFTISSANSDLYIGSRTLYGLAVERKAPFIFTRVDKRGLPWVAVLAVSLFTALTFLNLRSSSATVFAYGVNLLSAFGAITWMTIAYSHIRFMRALRIQGVSRDSLPYRAPCQPWGSWFVLVSTGIILLFKGFDTFFPFTPGLFITSYLPVPLFCALWLGYKLRFHTKLIPASKVDLITGKREIDEEEERFILLEKTRRAKVSRWWKLADML